MNSSVSLVLLIFAVLAVILVAFLALGLFAYFVDGAVRIFIVACESPGWFFLMVIAWAVALPLMLIASVVVGYLGSKASDSY